MKRQEIKLAFRNPEIVKEIFHYWDYIAKHHSELETVKFVKLQKQGQDEMSKYNKGLRWLLISLGQQQDDLYKVLVSMFSDPDYLLLYDKDKSYLWNYRREILESLQAMASKQLGEIGAKSIVAYREYVKIRTQATESKESDLEFPVKKEKIKVTEEDKNYKPMNVYHDYDEEEDN